MNYTECLDYVDFLKSRGSIPGLDRINELLRMLGDPHKSLKCIHVAGTNGKGSVCAMLSRILCRAGYKVGLYSSPYVERINELFKVNGKDIDDLDLCSVITEAKSACDAVGATQYEFLTAVAFLYFAKVSPDFVIVECCMGGLLDTTNVIEAPIMSVITSVALDHTSFLGDTVDKIAHHKAGIIKRGRPCVASVDEASGAQVILQTASANDAPLRFVCDSPRNVQATLDGTSFDHPTYGRLSTTLIGIHQARNAMTVIECCDILSDEGYKISPEDIKSGLDCTRLKARFEVIDRSVPVVYDGSHNVHGVLALVGTVKQIFGNQKIIAIASVMKDKDYNQMAGLIAPYIDTVFTAAPCFNERALAPETYAKVYKDLHVNSYPCQSLSEALRSALKAADKGQPIIAFGSLYSYKEFVDELNKIY